MSTTPTESPTSFSERYQLQSLLGEAGHFAVYRGTSITDGGAVTIRLLKSAEPPTAQATERFLARQRQLKALEHPNLVPLLDYGVDDERGPYLVHPYLNGQSLGSQMRGGWLDHLSFEERLKMVRGIGEGLRYIHNSSLVHGQLKPATIFLEQGATPRLVDIGTGDLIQELAPDSAASQRVQPGTYGTLSPAYDAPEVLEGGSPNIASDIFSFGCIAHELLTHTHPFNRLRSSQARDSAIDIAKSQLAPHVAHCLERALEFEPYSRCLSVEAMLIQLEREERATRGGLPIPWLIGGIASLLLAALALLFLRSEPAVRPAEPRQVVETPSAVETPSTESNAPTFQYYEQLAEEE